MKQINDLRKKNAMQITREWRLEDHEESLRQVGVFTATRLSHSSRVSVNSVH